MKKKKKAKKTKQKKYEIYKISIDINGKEYTHEKVELTAIN